MAGISLSYCQLIKIVLSQIGGNPLQQKYTTYHWKILKAIIFQNGLRGVIQ